MTAIKPSGGRGACRACRHFSDDPAVLERALPALAALSSAHGASRAGDGYCSRHDRYLPATASCAVFSSARGSRKNLGCQAASRSA